MVQIYGIPPTSSYGKRSFAVLLPDGQDRSLRPLCDDPLADHQRPLVVDARLCQKKH